MNAGAMGGATFDIVELVRFMDRTGNIFEKPRAEVPVEYRACPVFVGNIALAAVFKGVPTPRAEIEAKLNEFNRRRWEVSRRCRARVARSKIRRRFRRAS